MCRFVRGDKSGAFYFLLYGPVQDPPEATTLPTSEKVKDDNTA